MRSGTMTIRISAASQRSPDTISTPATARSVMLRIFSWKMPIGASATRVVDTRNWWPGERVLISPRSVREIDWAERLIHLDINRQKVKGGPPYDPAITIDGAYEEKFLTYYGIEWVAR